MTDKPINRTDSVVKLALNTTVTILAAQAQPVIVSGNLKCVTTVAGDNGRLEVYDGAAWYGAADVSGSALFKDRNVPVPEICCFGVRLVSSGAYNIVFCGKIQH